MIMEFKLDPAKAKTAGLEIEDYYTSLDLFFKEAGFKKCDEGMYWTDDVNKMAKSQLALTRTEWFTSVVSEWYGRFINDSINAREDVMEAYSEYGHLVK